MVYQRQACFMEEKDSKLLLSAFPPNTKEEWLKRLEKELKGKDVADLDWAIETQWQVAPMYQSSDMMGYKDILEEENQRASLRRSGQKGKWKVIQPLDYTDADRAVRIWEDAQKNDVDGFIMDMHDSNQAEDTFRQLLSKTDISSKHIFLSRPKNSVLPVTDMLISLANKRKKPDQLKGAIFHNPFARIEDQKSLLDATHILSCESGVKQTHASPNFRPIGIDLCYVQNCGGSIIQQLAFALSICVDYFDFFEKSNGNLTQEEIIDNMCFCLPVGSLFFPEITKFRAFRMLLGRLFEVLKIQHADVGNIPILARSSKWDMAHYDKHTNLLRLTTAAMAAIFGGVNALALAPFHQETLSESDTMLSARLSRNIQHILSHESHLDFVQDPGGGAYYIEIMTQKLAEASWKLFQKVEAWGGFSKAMKKGIIRTMLDSHMRQMLQAHATGNKQMVGISLSANPEETLELEHIETTTSKAGIYEAFRLKADIVGKENGKRIQVLLVGFGESRMQQARLRFSQNLFASGGFEPILVEWDKLETMAESTHPELVVLCAADKDYMEQGPSVLDLIHALFPESATILAGNPENWKSLGVSDVIYKGMNAPEFLKKWLEQVATQKQQTKN